MKEIIIRLKSKTPRFFKRLAMTGEAAGAAGLFIIGAGRADDLPVLTTALIAAGATGSFVARLVAENYAEIEKLKSKPEEQAV